MTSSSRPSKAELLYGVEVSPKCAQDAAALAAFLPYVEVLDLDEDAALHYAEIRADLKKRVAVIGANDCSSRRTRVRWPSRSSRTTPRSSSE